MQMRVVRGVVGIRMRMVIPTGINNLSGAQDRAAISPFAVARGRAWCARRELFAHVFGQGQTTARTRVAISATDGTGPFDAGRTLRRFDFEEVGMVFDPGG